MQTRFRETEDAYLTVYLSLVFAIVLSLLLALIQGAAAGAARAQADLIADLGMDSVFAEYNREVLGQYELFFIDTSYGTGYGGVGRLESRLKAYMEQNMDPDKSLSMAGATTLLKLNAPYLEIEEVSYASDENGAVWKAQAIAYMKAAYGGDLISTVKEHLDIVEGNALNMKDVAAETLQQREALEEALAAHEITEYNGESEEGFSYAGLSETADSLLGDGMLCLVLPRGVSVSGTVIDKSEYLSERMRSGKVNRGCGLRNTNPSEDGFVDELIYGEYLMKVCGNYAKVKEGGLLAYQIEYILYGNNSDAANLRASALSLFSLRSAANLIYLYSDSAKRKQVRTVAAVICTLLMVPELSDVLAFVIMGVWALAEAAGDVRTLLDGGRVPLLKRSGDWNSELSGIFGDLFVSGGGKEEGLLYSDYLRIFLALMNRKDKALRSLDIVEMDIRQTAGNEHFRIDRCVDYMQAGFGFSDAWGHEFVFHRRMCYE
ncbi:MAG: DUF5702 domain-containing protein [Roseburia sp.]|nr:DUF5702 domain-containing protein [Roseburia sp.]